MAVFQAPSRRKRPSMKSWKLKTETREREARSETLARNKVAEKGGGREQGEHDQPEENAREGDGPGLTSRLVGLVVDEEELLLIHEV